MSDPAPKIFYATSENGGYVTYFSSFRQSLTLRGSQVTGTRGLGTDLLSARAARPTRWRRPIPPASWPPGCERVYEFPAYAPQGRIESYNCTFELARSASHHPRGALPWRGGQRVLLGPDGHLREPAFRRPAIGVRLAQPAVDRADMELVDLEVLEPYTGS